MIDIEEVSGDCNHVGTEKFYEKFFDISIGSTKENMTEVTVCLRFTTDIVDHEEEVNTATAFIVNGSETNIEDVPEEVINVAQNVLAGEYEGTDEDANIVDNIVASYMEKHNIMRE